MREFAICISFLVICFAEFCCKLLFTIVVVGKSANVTDVDNPDWVPSKLLGYEIVKQESNNEVAVKIEVPVVGKY